MTKTGIKKVDKLVIKKIELCHVDNVEKREVDVTLNNGVKVRIISCYEGWQQCGGTLDELRATVHVAEKFNNWLHGID